MTRIKSSPPQPESSEPSVSVDELARQQGVGPVQNIDEIAALWPVDDDPDAMLKFILDERSQRRAAVQGKVASE